MAAVIKNIGTNMVLFGRRASSKDGSAKCLQLVHHDATYEVVAETFPRYQVILN